MSTIDLTNVTHRLDQSSSIKTTCAYCGVGCGVEINIFKALNYVRLKGDMDHPANFGKLCSKGSALTETLETESRLLYPEVFGQQSDWPTAISAVANGLQKIIQAHGPDAVAFYGSGQLLTEDYYVANKLMKGFIGSANMDTNSRLCMASTSSAHKRAFGTDTVPNCYDDLDEAELIILIGANSAWCHPVLFQRITKAKENKPSLKIVVIDPRHTTSCDIADVHLQIRSGSDGKLFNGLLAYLADKGKLDHDYIDHYTEGFEDTLKSAQADFPSLEDVAKACGISTEVLTTFFDLYAQNDKVVSLYSQGVNQSTSGTDKVNAILNCHLATGRIGKPGSGPLSLTGQPNAMGGREVGGLATILAAHLGFKPEDTDIVGRFWGSNKIPKGPGLTAVELFNAVAEGKVKAVWIMATNPVFSLPDADKVKAALAACELVIVSDCVARSDTLDLADIKLPAAGWSEKDGTVTNSERRISRQRAFKPLSGEARPDWWIISEVAKAMGFAEHFNYSHPVDIFREHARLSAFENHEGGKLRDFNLSAFKDITAEEYEQLAPVQWPVTTENPEGTARLFSKGGFFTENRKAKFIPVTAKPPKALTNKHYPFVLNTGRIRDQWHSMSRTGLSARLNLHKPEPYIDIHPEDATSTGLSHGSLAQVESHWGSMLARVNHTHECRRGNIFVPMHWTGILTSKGRVGAVVNPFTDPLSFQPESKHTPVRVNAWPCAWQGFVISRDKLDMPDLDYRVDIRLEKSFRYEIADQQQSIEQVEAQLIKCLDHDEDISWQRLEDPAMNLLRIAGFKEDKLLFVAMFQATHELPARDWLTSLISKQEPIGEFRNSLLSGRPPAGAADTGKQICACFNVGEKTIRQLILDKGLKSAEDVGRACKAGTNCGACVPEIKHILQS